jgi:sec-independent protein translocase protein TatA
MPFGMGFGELVLILVIVMVVFGATKLPQLGDGLGRAIKNFKRSVGALNEIDVTPRHDDRTDTRSENSSTNTSAGTADSPATKSPAAPGAAAK